MSKKNYKGGGIEKPLKKKPLKKSLKKVTTSANNNPDNHHQTEPKNLLNIVSDKYSMPFITIDGHGEFIEETKEHTIIKLCANILEIYEINENELEIVMKETIDKLKKQNTIFYREVPLGAYAWMYFDHNHTSLNLDYIETIHSVLNDPNFKYNDMSSIEKKIQEELQIISQNGYNKHINKDKATIFIDKTNKIIELLKEKTNFSADDKINLIKNIQLIKKWFLPEKITMDPQQNKTIFTKAQNVASLHLSRSNSNVTFADVKKILIEDRIDSLKELVRNLNDDSTRIWEDSFRNKEKFKNEQNIIKEINKLIYSLDYNYNLRLLHLSQQFWSGYKESIGGNNFALYFKGNEEEENYNSFYGIHIYKAIKNGKYIDITNSKKETRTMQKTVPKIATSKETKQYPDFLSNNPISIFAEIIKNLSNKVMMTDIINLLNKLLNIKNEYYLNHFDDSTQKWQDISEENEQIYKTEIENFRDEIKEKINSDFNSEKNKIIFLVIFEIFIKYTSLEISIAEIELLFLLLNIDIKNVYISACNENIYSLNGFNQVVGGKNKKKIKNKNKKNKRKTKRKTKNTSKKTKKTKKQNIKNKKHKTTKKKKQYKR